MSGLRSPSRDVERRAATPTGSLGEDDGMHDLRRKMLEIQELALSTAETALRMHELMTHDYKARHGIQDRVQKTVPAGRPLSALTSPNIFVTEADKQPCYSPDVKEQDDLEETLGEEQSGRSLGCEHYKRNVKVQCFDCGMWFPCRFCHDSSPDLPWHHQLNRKKTQNMLCMVCGTAQPAADVCSSCMTEAAYYYCSKCKLWDNDGTKRIYHCDDCGICRIGEGLGKDYVHCKRCNVCISISTSSTHPCIERATDCDCPLCLDYLFSSSTPVVSLLCGHYMHATCYKDLMNVTYRCPVCSKSAVNMELQWRKLDDEIRMQPMPEEDFEEEQDRPDTPDSMGQSDTRLAGGLASLSLFSQPTGARRVPRKVWVGCNDCGGRGWTPFHWLGLKCPVCDGYNTNQMTPTGSRFATAASIPGTSRQRQHDFTGAAIMGSVVLDDANAESIPAAGPSEPIDVDRLRPRPSTSAGSMPSRSYFFPSSPSSPPSERGWVRRSWGSSLSPSRFAPFRTAASFVTSTADNDIPAHDLPPPAAGDPSSRSPSCPPPVATAQTEAEAAATAAKKDADHFSLAVAGLDRFGISPSDFLSRVGISPSEFLARLNISSPGDFLERFGVSPPLEFLQKVSRSLSPMRHYLESLDQNARDRANKAREGVNVFAANWMADGGKGMRWSRRDVAEGIERWDRFWREYYASLAGAAFKDGQDRGAKEDAGGEGERAEQEGQKMERPVGGHRRAKSETDINDGVVVGDADVGFLAALNALRVNGFSGVSIGKQRGVRVERAVRSDTDDDEEEEDEEESDSESERSDGGFEQDGLDDVDDFELPGHR